MTKITLARKKKLQQRRKNLAERSEGNSMLYFKADETVRIRPLPVKEDEEFGMEIVYFYPNSDIKGLISPMTFGEPCAIYDKYQELKESKDEGDKKLAEALKPKRKFVVPCIKYKDTAGKQVDEKAGVKLAQLTPGQYQDMIDLFLDDDNGDFTDPRHGYDLKITRTGSGQFDTEYNMLPGKKSALNPKFNKVYDIKELLRKEVLSYEETVEKLNEFLGVDGDARPKKKKIKPGSPELKKKKLKKKL